MRESMKEVRKKALKYFYLSGIVSAVVLGVVQFFFGTVLFTKGGYVIPFLSGVNCSATMPEIPFWVSCICVPFLVFGLVQMCLRLTDVQFRDETMNDARTGLVCGLLLSITFVIGWRNESVVKMYELNCAVLAGTLMLSGVFENFTKTLYSVLGTCMCVVPAYVYTFVSAYSLEGLILIPGFLIFVFCVLVSVSTPVHILRAHYEVLTSREFWSWLLSLRVVSTR